MAPRAHFTCGADMVRGDRPLLLILLLAMTSMAASQQEPVLSVGSVRVPEGVTVVIINNRGESVTIHGRDGPVNLPIGTYRIDSWAMDRLDRDGSAWQAKGAGLGKNGVFEVGSGGETPLSIAEPIISSLTVRKERSTYYVSHSFTSRLSETVEITKNGSRPDAPKLEIRNADGSYQETLTFEYG